MPHKFDPANVGNLDRPDRAEWQPVGAFLDLLRPREGGEYADLGCGAGYFTIAVAERIGPRGTVYALDVQPEMLRELRARIRERELDNILPILSRERELPLPDGAIEALWTANTFHELDAPFEVMLEVRRVLRRDGRAFVIDWKREETPVGPPVEERVGVADVLETLRRAKFREIREHDVYPHHHVVEALR